MWTILLLSPLQYSASFVTAANMPLLRIRVKVLPPCSASNLFVCLRKTKGIVSNEWLTVYGRSVITLHPNSTGTILPILKVFSRTGRVTVKQREANRCEVGDTCLHKPIWKSRPQSRNESSRSSKSFTAIIHMTTTVSDSTELSVSRVKVQEVINFWGGFSISDRLLFFDFLSQNGDADRSIYWIGML